MATRCSLLNYKTLVVSKIIDAAKNRDAGHEQFDTMRGNSRIDPGTLKKSSAARRINVTDMHSRNRQRGGERGRY